MQPVLGPSKPETSTFCTRDERVVIGPADGAVLRHAIGGQGRGLDRIGAVGGAGRQRAAIDAVAIVIGRGGLGAVGVGLQRIAPQRVVAPAVDQAVGIGGGGGRAEAGVEAHARALAERVHHAAGEFALGVEIGGGGARGDALAA